ncbi:MAG: 50S ribosomal protein L11 methyltransferase [Gammaproteobacteria bacterium]|nr:50S ribosomal protein L11 methyltransferase [Gammaproteobacteria bacterium]
MSWTELTLEADAAEQESLSDWLFDQGAVAVSLKDASGTPIREPGPGETPVWPRLWLVGLFDQRVDCRGVGRRLTQVGHPDWTLATVPERDWIRAGQDQFEPQQIGPSFWVCPSWRAPPDPQAVTLLLDPGLAFGTGNHETTALCLERLVEIDLRGLDIVDYGCGSGILGLAALKLGAGRVRAVDIDPQALQATAENARLNGIGDELVIGQPGELDLGSADLLIANILLTPLLELRDRFKGLLHPGGRLLLSGLLEEQGPILRSAYAENFRFGVERVRTPWLFLEAEKHF